jgi:hypothetical protein
LSGSTIASWGGKALDSSDRAAPGERGRLAAEDAEGRLGNQLARVAAYCELLAGDPDLPPEARERARRAMLAAFEAAETLRVMLRERRAADPASSD